MVLFVIMLYSFIIVVKNFKHFTQMMKFYTDEKIPMILQNKNNLSLITDLYLPPQLFSIKITK